MTGKSAGDKNHKTQDPVCYRLKRNFSAESETSGAGSILRLPRRRKRGLFRIRTI